ncbi:uncharacterized protein K489DRAFT_65540 [Dissoconium aciculare CBS 342.82]|uniref:Uncharacterized protein n=1 Tax=Dissoconium aciculare CBS 342.82 TaxID=1314786 RepID=A0A6J3LUE1_9PEZI|nr:uncharacterized protein K489DRAFT_65540 [Dissoconium aciculare CBS 342.82]KAF1819401.1 hypothetical protein K489DRAFT_65540 [Dissoconium aciculare CBS 342.82]
MQLLSSASTHHPKTPPGCREAALKNPYDEHSHCPRTSSRGLDMRQFPRQHHHRSESSHKKEMLALVGYTLVLSAIVQFWPGDRSGSKEMRNTSKECQCFVSSAPCERSCSRRMR